jgi:hypothetical protein
MIRPQRLLAGIGLLAAISCSNAMAQATGSRVLDHQVRQAGDAPLGRSRLSSQWATRLPSPVRRADHQGALTVLEPAQVSSLTPIEISRGLPAHRILRAPVKVPSSESTARHHAHHAPKTHVPRPPHAGLRRRIAPPPAMLPEANRRDTWKAPYSYGYFGASGKRHWSLSHGYRDRYTQWDLQ